ncbi:MAG: glutamate--tRNA ligase [Alphaproteobacteria bacterium]
MSVVTRFAPSPTGYLHIGGARTALFNWLYARHHGGQYLLRIEDTDRVRSTKDAIDAILDGLSWLGLTYDGEVVYQFTRAARHAEVAKSLLQSGNAYWCYCTPEELAAMREAARREGRPVRYDGRWRDRDPALAPKDVKPVLRLKAPILGTTIIHDLVQGDVNVANNQLDDMVLLRSDGTPTYMLSVVVDDHDMGITHIIRGDDHLTNAFRQYQLYDAFGWTVPQFAHIPLIHGPDGAKLSKRHGALGIDAYRDMGYLPEALCNYLLRLGWGHGDDEIISRQQAIDWFDLDAVGRSPSRLDFAKLENLNAHYIRESDNQYLVDLIIPHFESRVIGRSLSEDEKRRLFAAIPGLKPRVKTVNELMESAVFYIADRPIPLDEKARALLDSDAKKNLEQLRGKLADAPLWQRDQLEALVRAFCEAATPPLKLGKIAQPLRAALTGQVTSPPIFEAMEILGKSQSLGRIDDVLG